MRDEPWERARSVLVAAAERLDANDPWQVEALGPGATGKRDELYAELKRVLPGFPTTWTPAYQRIAWRLHPRAAVPALQARALARDAELASRQLAIDALAFTEDESAARALQEIAASAEAELADWAAWWLDRNAETLWSEFDTAHARPSQYDPQLFIDFRALADAESDTRSELPAASEILALPADASRGRELFATGGAPCSACHVSDGIGGSIGPDLSQVHARLGRAEIVVRMLRPTSELMPSASSLRLAAQDVADLAAYLSAR
jgi:mono/diheme cytochrome c family protein